MKNVFKPYVPQHNIFAWDKLGNIREGRGDMGETMLVPVYRLMHRTLMDVLCRNEGKSKAIFYFTEAGRLAGYEFAQSCLSPDCEFEAYFQNLATLLLHLNVAVMKLEAYDADSGDMTVVVAQDMSNSGLPEGVEHLTHFDAGFLAGVCYAYTGEDHLFEVETDAFPGKSIFRFHGRVMW